MACTPDTITPKGVTINLNSDSDYTNCTVYTGLTDSTVTGTTDCVNITGTTCTLTGLSATLMEVYVKIDCEGCCSNTFRVNLDECCGDIVTTPTPTPTVTPTGTSTPTVTSTSTPTSSVCECNTYRITFIANCGEFINWTDCNTNTPMSEQGDYFGLPTPQFTMGTVLDLCSCSLPTTDCTLVTISLVTTGCTLEGGFITTTSTITPTPTPTSSNIQFTVQTGDTTCNGGTCQLNGNIGNSTIYMGVSDSFVDSTIVFSDAGLTTAFPDTNAINPGASYPNLYYVLSGVLYIDCLKGGGC